jgi:hypothetical protein
LQRSWNILPVQYPVGSIGLVTGSGHHMSILPPTYNLPGFGLIKVRLFPYAETVFDFLNEYGHIDRLRRTNQLGALREILPGAHHTRFEYLIAQLGIISELCTLKGTLPEGMSLSSTNGPFPQLPGFQKKPSNGEVLQIFALLANLGHVPSTFSGERGFLHVLRNDNDARRAFRTGLTTEDRPGFDKVVDEFKVYQAAHYLTLFLLNRYRRKEGGAGITEFCSAILRSYLTVSSQSTRTVISLWALYRSIRRLTYLALDSLYTPVPFSLDLASIFLSLDHYLKDVFQPQSPFQDALEKLEGVMRDAVYLSPPALLQIASATRSAISGITQGNQDLNTIGGLWDLLGPGDRNDAVFQTSDGSATAFTPRAVLVPYDCLPHQAPSVLCDTVAWERTARERAGLRASRYGAEWDPTRSHLRIAAAVADSVAPSDVARVSFAIARELATFDLEARNTLALTPLDQWRSGRPIVEFLLRATFGWGRAYRFLPLPVSEMSPVIITRGAQAAARQVSLFREIAERDNMVGRDGLNELSMLSRALDEIDYKGLLIAYAGSSEVVEKGQKAAEFDGLVFLLSDARRERNVIVVEAKNTANGQTEARNQLTNRLGALLPGKGVQYRDLGRKGAAGAFAA